MPYQFRFSIGQLMGLIALSALVMTNAIFVSRGSLTSYTLIAVVADLAGLAVLLYNRRLSRWIWVWIAGQSAPLLLMLVQALLRSLFSNYGFLAIQTSFYLFCSFLTVVGLAMTFRDIRRKLAVYENAPSCEAQGLTAPTN
jgi:hypothetical protein